MDNTSQQPGDTPVIELSPPEMKRPCCGALKIQPHSPDCTGEVRRRPSKARGDR